MKGNFHVRFLGGKAPVRELTYPALGQYQPEHPGGQRGVRFQQLPVCGDNLRTAVARQVEQHHGTEPCNPLPAVELGQVGQ